MSIESVQVNNAVRLCSCHMMMTAYYYPNKPCCPCKKVLMDKVMKENSDEKRIKELEKKVNNLIEEIFVSSKTISGLVDQVDHCEEGIENCFDKLDNHLSPCAYVKLKEKIDKLENLILDSLTRIPHKCPLCHGHGKRGYPEVLQDKCHGCDGKGIIW